MIVAFALYHYQASLVRVKDGDSAVLRFDLGFNVSLNLPVRIAGLNAPELRGPDSERARRARARLGELLTGRTLWVVTDRDRMTFERYVARVYLDPEKTQDVAAVLIAEGLAEPYPAGR